MERTKNATSGNRLAKAWVLGLTGAMVACATASEVDTSQLERRIDELDSALQTVEADLEVAKEGLADTEKRLTQAETSLGDTESRLTEAEASLEDTNAQLLEAQARLDALPGSLQLEGGLRVLTVPGDASDLASALELLDDVWFVGGGGARIEVSDGTWSVSLPVRPSHPQGDRIDIIGNPARPGNVVLACTDTACLDVSAGSLGVVDGITLRGTASVPGQVGVSLSGPFRVRLGEDVQIEDFSGAGILASGGGTVSASGVLVDGCNIGIRAEWGASILADGAVVTGSGDRGISAYRGGFVDASAATASDGAAFGISAEYGSFALAAGSLVEGFGQRGITAGDGGAVDASNAIVRNNGAGLDAAIGSAIKAFGTLASGNDTDVQARMLGVVNLNGSSVFTTTAPAVGTDAGQNSWIQ